MGDDLAVLATAVGQVESLLAAVGPEDRDKPTPCEQWTVAELAGHVAGSTAGMASLLRGEEVDWAAPPPGPDEALAAFRAAAQDLEATWRAKQAAGETPAQPLSWPCAELAVHTWDLATALGRGTAELAPEVAEAGLGFMQGALKDEMRGEAFGPAREAPPDADAYGRIAAFAGRDVG